MHTHEFRGVDLPRVLIVENDPIYRRDHQEHLRRWGFEPVLASGRGWALLKSAIEQVRLQRCHAALVDMRLIYDRDRDDVSGLTLVEHLWPAVSIIVSAYHDLQRVRQALLDGRPERRAGDIVNKRDGPEALRAALEKVLREQCGWQRQVAIQWPEGLSGPEILRLFFADSRGVPATEVEELLCRLFPQARTLRLEHLGEHNTPSLAPRQRSVVLKIYEDARQPIVVKLARAARIKTEAERYAEHIDGKMVGHFYAQLQGAPCLLWDLGGATYTFLGNPLSRMRSFSQFYTISGPTSIRRSLRHLFDRTWSGHYAASREPSEATLFAAYSAVWDGAWEQRLRAYPTGLADELLERALPGHGLPNPISWTLCRIGVEPPGPDQSGVPGSLTAITHGDLLGDNLFVDENCAAWVIDYERSGRGPIVQDFVELEADILTRLALLERADLPAYAAMVRALMGVPRLDQAPTIEPEHPELRKALTVIVQLRRLARKQTGVRDSSQYLWGLLFNAMFRATLLHAVDGDLPHLERSLLLGAMICERLSQQPAAPPPRAPRARTRKDGGHA